MATCRQKKQDCDAEGPEGLTATLMATCSQKKQDGDVEGPEVLTATRNMVFGRVCRLFKLYDTLEGSPTCEWKGGQLQKSSVPPRPTPTAKAPICCPCQLNGSDSDGMEFVVNTAQLLVALCDMSKYMCTLFSFGNNSNSMNWRC